MAEQKDRFCFRRVGFMAGLQAAVDAVAPPEGLFLWPADHRQIGPRPDSAESPAGVTKRQDQWWAALGSLGSKRMPSIEEKGRRAGTKTPKTYPEQHRRP